MNLNIEFKLSLYEELKLLHKSNKVKIFLVQNVQNEKIYIKKEIREYTKNVYESISNIKSINMPQIYEIFEFNDTLIIIEEFINGDTLQSILEKEKKLDEKRIVKYMISLCNILEQIHGLEPSVIHRDIKPANIIISNDDVLKLIDFDIARTYKEGESLDTTLLGTKGYASPEQFGFNQTDCRSDIYAIGIMMNVLSTGKHTKEEENKGILKDIIKKCTHISPDERYQNILELRKELDLIYNKENQEILINNKVKIKNINRQSKNRYTFKEIIKEIPGFRRKNLIYMFLSSFLYMFFIFALFIGSNINEHIENISLVIILLLIFLLFTNFLNNNEILPIIKSKHKSVKIFGFWIYTIALLSIGGAILEFL